ncbi:MAG: aminoglycoside adenylyltransferase domain-containing protein [Acidimicrobiales bacterium]
MTTTGLPTPNRGPTRFDELNDVLEELVTVARRVLANNFIGAYLQGSFALDTGDLASDCDFLVVTRGPVTPVQELGLRAFHDELPTREGFWNRHMEGSYAPADDLKTLSGLGRDWLYIDHGWREMQWHQHCNSAVARWILHECGVTLAGPPAKEVVDALPEGVLRETMRVEIPAFAADLLSWIPDIAGFQRYAVDMLCRMWFTFETEEVALKSDSVRWALRRLDARWHPLLQNAIDDRLLGFDPKQRPAKHFVDATLEFAELITASVQDNSLNQRPDHEIERRSLPPSVIYLIGSLAVGKFTVAKAIAEINGAAVVDNQLINLPIFSLLTEWPDAEVTDGMWREIDFVRDAVFRMIEEVVPRSVSYVLTNALEDDPESHALYERVKRIAASRGSTFLPVMLTCELEEQLRRIPEPARTQRMKIDDLERARHYIESTTFFNPNEEDVFTVDTTSSEPSRIAELILEELRERESSGSS